MMKSQEQRALQHDPMETKESQHNMKPSHRYEEGKDAGAGHKRAQAPRPATSDDIPSKKLAQKPAEIFTAACSDEYCIVVRQGSRNYMQDFYSAQPSLRCNCTGCLGSEHLNAALYVICDGHGDAGEVAAQKAAKFLSHKWLNDYLPKLDASDAQSTMRALHDCFLEVDEKLISEINPKAGTTVTVAFIHNNELYIANVGDSTGKLCKRNLADNSITQSGEKDFACMQVTVDHHPDDEKERARVEERGGEVIENKGLRVAGVLNMTRSLGNSELKPAISGKPSVKCIHLDPSSNDCEHILILSSDGLWNFVEDDEVTQSIIEATEAIDNLMPTAQQMELESEINHRPDPSTLKANKAKAIAEALGEKAKQNRSSDNLTVCVIVLNAYITALGKN
jgi:serine/threonine protein phosphatase PrpC